MTGSYCLLVYCGKSQLIKVGRLGEIEFKKGYYLYVGSALKGIESRVCRHLRNSKKVFWHIDYLLAASEVEVSSIYYIESSKKLECDVSKKVEVIAMPVEGFGSSDCSCISHLFYISKKSLAEINELLGHYNFNLLRAAAFSKKFCRHSIA